MAWDGHCLFGAWATVIFDYVFASLSGSLRFSTHRLCFNPSETADNLKKNGGFLPGIRPGKNTGGIP